MRETVFAKIFLALVFSVWATAAAIAQNAPAGDDEIKAALDLAASELDWPGEIQSMALDARTKLFMVRDTKGMIAITAYGSKDAAEIAFTSSGKGEETNYRDYRSLGSEASGSISWLASAIVFSVASGAGETGKLASALFQAATDSALLQDGVPSDKAQQPTAVTTSDTNEQQPDTGTGKPTPENQPGLVVGGQTETQDQGPAGSTELEEPAEMPGIAELLAQGNEIMRSAFTMADEANRTEAFASALALFSKAADMGSAEAIYNIGYLYETGNGVEQDNDIAISHYDAAATSGYGEAFRHMILVQNQLGRHEAAASSFFRYYKAFPQQALQGFDDFAYSPQVLRAIQRHLKTAGYYRGAIDGDIGSGTRAAIEDFVRNEIPDELIHSDAPQQDSAPAGTSEAMQLAFWQSIRDSADPADFQAYLDQWPNGVFAALARNKINRLGPIGGPVGTGMQPGLPATGPAASIRSAGDRINSDESWKVTAANPPGAEWLKPSFDDSGWQAAQAGWANSPTPPRNIINMEDTDAQWIWQAGDPDQVLFRKTFTVAAQPAFAQLRITADNNYTAFINGAYLGTDSGARESVWKNAEVIDIAPYLQAGANTIAVIAEDLGGGSGLLADIRFRQLPAGAAGPTSGPATVQPPKLTQPKIQKTGGYYTPARGTAERKQIMDAVRIPVSSEIGQSVIFVVDVLRADGEWAYLQAVPHQPDGSPLNWNQTPFAQPWQADMMSDIVMVLLKRQNGQWVVVDHVIGPTDVYWYGWVDQFGLPERLFFAG